MVKYLFEGSERSDDLLRRMFAGEYLTPSSTEVRSEVVGGPR